MTIKEDVEKYLNELRAKINIWNIIFRDDRTKNAQTLLDLDIPPIKRKEIILSLSSEDYSEGPLDEKLHGILPMWVFGKQVKNQEIYIKVSLGVPNGMVICISFHIAEHPIKYPFKQN